MPGLKGVVFVQARRRGVSGKADGSMFRFLGTGYQVDDTDGDRARFEAP